MAEIAILLSDNDISKFKIKEKLYKNTIVTKFKLLDCYHLCY